ncbi:hypothetical protein D3C85_1292160 [compost metagenome]
MGEELVRLILHRRGPRSADLIGVPEIRPFLQRAILDHQLVAIDLVTTKDQKVERPFFVSLRHVEPSLILAVFYLLPVLVSREAIAGAVGHSWRNALCGHMECPIDASNRVAAGLGFGSRLLFGAQVNSPNGPCWMVERYVSEVGYCVDLTGGNVMSWFRIAKILDHQG